MRAAVRVSLICFGHATQTARLDGDEVELIPADLSVTHGVSKVRKLVGNSGASYIGTQKNGPFDIPRDLAAQWLRLPNPNGKSNALVVRPWANGLDVTRRPQNRWVVDFGCDMSLSEAALFETPFAYVDQGSNQRGPMFAATGTVHIGGSTVMRVLVCVRSCQSCSALS